MDWDLENNAVAVATAVRATLGASLDLYEASMQSLTEAQWELAGLCDVQPARALGSVWSDAGRDVTAIALSTLRWWLHL